MPSIRMVSADDLPALRDLYAGSVLAVGLTHYTPEQVQAWAASAWDERFESFSLKPMTVVAVHGDTITGFGGIEPDGHITSLYVHAGHLRQGVGTLILQHLIDHAQQQRMSRLHAEASYFSKPLFEKCGFTTSSIERSIHKGVAFERYLMGRSLI